MFRKNYKEAMNDIKPDAAFVESVIAASKKRRPSLRPRFVKYAAAAAAAVVVVSGTVLSMPLWNKVQNNNDGIISETTTAETAAPAANADKTAEEQPEITPAPKDGNKSDNTSKAALGSVSKGASAKTETPEKPKQNEPQQDTQINVADEKPQQPENAIESVAESADDGEEVTVSGIVMAETDEEVRENKAPSDKAPYREQEDVSAAATAAPPEVADADIPTPTGYRCTSATPRGYTFVNDEGAVIVVTINYGGEEREPYIEENENNIYAVFTSYGLSVTINASGAERESVEEIINSLR